MKYKFPGIILLLFLFQTFSIAAQENLADREIILPQKEWNIASLMNYLENTYQVMFAFVPDEIPLIKKVEINGGTYRLKVLIERMFRGTDIQYSFVAKQILLKKVIKSRNKFIIKGKISDVLTGESLTGANVFIFSTGIGAVSNAYGFYSLTLPDETTTVVFSFIGYESIQKIINLNSPVELDIALKPLPSVLNEVVIEGKSVVTSNITNTTPGLHYLSANEIRAMPGLGGQPDVLKSIQYFPGVVPLNDGIALYSVRGGGADQNLILLDEAPVYNPSHVLGFFSVFNPDAVQSVEIMKGYIPARYGGRLSSVANIRMKEGNRNKFGMNGYIDLLSVGLTLESPLLSNKTSFLVSGRYFNLTPASKIVSAIRDIVYLPGMNNFDENNRIHFYDLNLKINHRFSGSNQLYFSAYTGRDGFYFAQIDDRSRQDWGNTTAALRWNHVAGDKLFFNVTLLYSRYNYSFNLHDGAYKYEWRGEMNQGDIKADFDYYLNANNHIEFGTQISHLNILPGEIISADSTNIRMNNRKSLEPSVYISNNQKITKWLTLNYGIRATTFISFHDRDSGIVTNTYNIGKHFYSFEPRISLCLLFSESLSFKASYNRTSQSLHLVSNSTVGMPTDIWIPSDKYIQPQTADQYSIGLFSSMVHKKVETSVELYYKSMLHILDFKDNASMRFNEYLENELLAGSGRSYGFEFLIRKPIGRFSGWLGYTLSKTERKIEGVNLGLYYPAKYDHRHNITAFVSQDLSKRLTLSATFNYRTGNAITMPLGIFDFKGESYAIYSSRNGYRLPANHRLDITLLLKGRQTLKWRSDWSISVYNVYSRKNIFSYHYYMATYVSEHTVRKLYFPGAIPMIRYAFQF